MATLILTGRVKFFNDTKGYGFIKENNSDKEYFFHFSGALDKVRKDDDVSFELDEKGQRGVKAVRVKKLQE
jgi:CspA family cold shock protein